MIKKELEDYLITCDICDDELEFISWTSNVGCLKGLKICSDDCLLEIMEDKGLIWTSINEGVKKNV